MRVINLGYCIIGGVFVIAGCSTAPESSAPAKAASTVLAAGVRWEDAADAPDAVVSKSPVYPFEAWRSRKTGYARVIFRTDSNGHVTDLRCVAFSDKAFYASTMTAVAQWKFSQKEAGPFRLEVRYHFSEGGASIEWK